MSWLATTKFLAYIDSYKDNQKIPKDLAEFVANNPIDPYIEEQLPAWQAMARRFEAEE